MAYATEITRDTLVQLVLRTVRGLSLGVTPPESQEDEVEQFLNIAIKSFDGAGWMRQGVASEATAAISANADTVTVSSSAHSVLSAYYFATGDGTAANIDIVSPKICFANGPIYARGIPSHGCFIKPSTSAGILYFNRRVPADGSILYTYRTSLEILSGDTTKFLTTGLGEEFLMAVVLMTAVDMAPAFALTEAEMQDLRWQLDMHLNMLKGGQQLIFPGTVPTLSGQIPPSPTQVGPDNM